MSGFPMHLTVAGMVCALSLAACLPRPNDPIIYVPPDSAAMKTAMENARASLDAFFDAREHNDGGNSQFGVKLSFPTSDKSEEHMWLWVDDVQGDKLVGHVANIPVDVPDIQRGSSVNFTRAQIEDWQFERGGRSYGQFTTRAMFNHAKTPEEQAEAKEVLASLWPNAIPEKH